MNSFQGCQLTAASRVFRSAGFQPALRTRGVGFGFGVVAFSGFATLREFGLLSAATMGLCVVADLILLPAVLGRGR